MRVPVFWSGLQTQGGGLTNFFFDPSAGTPAQAVTAVVNFLLATDDRRVVGCDWACGTDVDTLDIGTGTLLSTVSFAPAIGHGVDAGDPLPPTVQGLLQLVTPAITAGRVLRGRIFLPASSETWNIGGVPLAAYRNDYEAAAATMIGLANADWVVWSRTHGVTASVTSATLWTKWASLRSRRD